MNLEKSKEEDMSLLWKGGTCGKTYLKKSTNLEEKVKKVEGDVIVV
jgi:hypothetical protein